MIIQNFFSDTLLSVLGLFENYIFDNKHYWFQNVTGQSKPKNFFRYVEFNIGNRNFQIGNYKKSAQLEFPAGLFTLVSDETAFGKMGNLIGHHRIWDVNQITCTHNNDTNIDIMLREEQAIIYLTVQINCESILHANEVTHQIKRFLPPGKYCQLAPHSTFNQIPNYFFHPKYNNPDIHDIDNLFCKYDGATGEKQYFYLAHYKPCIRLNSVNAEISDNSARAFPVLCDFSYLIQLPMWMFDTYDEEKIVRIHLGVNSSDNISSIVHDNQFLSVNDEPVYINDIPYKQSYKYVIDLTSPNYHDDRIVIPAPKNDDYIVQVAKLEQKNSTIVNFAGFHKSLPKEIKKENLRYDLGLRNLRAEILEEGS